MSRFFGDKERVEVLLCCLVALKVLLILTVIAVAIIDRAGEREVVPNQRSYIIESGEVE